MSYTKSDIIYSSISDNGFRFTGSSYKIEGNLDNITIFDNSFEIIKINSATTTMNNELILSGTNMNNFVSKFSLDADNDQILIWSSTVDKYINVDASSIGGGSGSTWTVGSGENSGTSILSIATKNSGGDATGAYSLVNGFGNSSNNDNSIMLGGINNFFESGNTSENSVIIGGEYINLEKGNHNSIMFVGSGNTVYYNSPHTTMIGGHDNTINWGSDNATIIGGKDHILENNTVNSAIIGGRGHILENNTVNSAIIGGHGNTIQYSSLNSSLNSSILGGTDNTIEYSSDYCTIIGGYSNIVDFEISECVVIGGQNNHVGEHQYGSSGLIIGGYNNMCDGTGSAIIGGHDNSIGDMNSQDPTYCTIIGGYNNYIDEYGVGYYCDCSTIIGGHDNDCTGENSAVIGGSNLTNNVDNSVMVPCIILSSDSEPHGRSGYPNDLDGTIYLDSGGTFRGYASGSWHDLYVS